VTGGQSCRRCDALGAYCSGRSAGRHNGWPCLYFLGVFKSTIPVGLIVVLVGCAASGPYKIDLMPAPEIYDEETLTPFSDLPGEAEAPYWGMLYATDRTPVDPDAEQPPKERFYENERGHLVRLGIAHIELGEGDFSWEEARQISLAKNRTDQYPLKVTAVDELGVLDRSFSEFETPESLALKSPEAGQRFAALINKKLALSTQQDIFIYIHGYKVVFDNPILVATELWHYLGYEGVFIAYAWPSTPSRWAYFGDAETAMTTAYGLRVFLEYLAEETKAKRIHIIGYSQGTRLVIQTLYNIALINHNKSREAVQKKMRIGRVVLIGSDVERQMMGTFIADGLLKVPQHLTVYVSEGDKALDLSTFFFGRKRLGQMFSPGEMALTTAEFLWETPQVSVVNVTAAEGATSGNGHSYFRSSPWASSDMLMALRYGLPPGERGLVQSDDSPIWTFPEDYIDRLRTKLIELNPAHGNAGQRVDKAAQPAAAGGFEAR
jgi:esterase/lipase superfamily enzyme